MKSLLLRSDAVNAHLSRGDGNELRRSLARPQTASVEAGWQSYCWGQVAVSFLVLFFLGAATVIDNQPLSVRAPQQLGNPPNYPTTKQAQAAELYRQSPMYFEANQGQTDGRVKFLARGSGYSLFLTEVGATFALQRPRASAPTGTPRPATGVLQARPAATPLMLRMQLLGANRAAQARGLKLLPSKSNYAVGNDPEQWRTGIPHYAKVEYQHVYPGIDLIYYGNQQELEYDFVVAPGANPNRIKLAFDGARKIRIDERGELVLETAAGELRQHKPVIYQEVDGARREIPGHFVLRGRQVSFALGDYDRTRSLVIDPSLVYSTYLGGSDADFGNGIDVDAQGNAYVTGITYSPDFPTRAPLQFSLQGVGNVFIAKLDPAGQLIYATYLGGSGEDVGFAIAADAAGNAYVTGATDSSNFPIIAGAAQAVRRGRLEVFVSKLNPTGSQLLYSTFLGGQSDDVAGSIAVNAAGEAYVTGETLASDFPLQNAIQRTLNGPTDAFVTRLNASGSGLIYSTLLGGRGQEFAYGITLDAAGSAYITGITYSDNFPTRNPTQALLGGRVDAFVTKLAPAGNELIYSTYLGGAHDDGGFGIGVDGAGNAFVAGFTTSTNFPTRNPFQASNGGGDDAFVARFNAAGELVFASYLGGAGNDRAFDLVVDAAGNIYFAGRTESTNFPLVNPLQIRIGLGQVNVAPTNAKVAGKQPREAVAENYGRDATRWAGAAEQASYQQQQTEPRDAFVVKISAAGVIIYSTYLGGSDEEKAFGIAVDTAGNVYVTGLTASGDFPIRNAVQAVLRGIADAFITKISDAGSAQTSVSAASFQGGSLAREAIVAAFGSDLAAQAQAASATALPTLLGATSVQVRDSAGGEHLAPLFFISPQQINYLVPAGAAQGTATITTLNGNLIVGTETIQIAAVAPGLFTANADGRGVPAAVILRVKESGNQTFESLAEFDAAAGRFIATPVDLGSESDQVFLVLFGTGLRHRSALTGITASIGGVSAPALFAAANPDFTGMDQINLRLARSLVGRGEVDVVLTVDGQAANTVRIKIK